MGKLINILAASIFLISINAKEYEKKEPRYFLVFKLLESVEPSLNSKIDLFENPDKTSIVKTIKKGGSFSRLEYLKRFNNNQEPPDFMFAPSIEKNGNFFKVFYKEKFLWVHKTDLTRIYNITEYFLNLGPFVVKSDNYKWAFDKINGKNREKNKIFPIKKLYTEEELEKSDLGILKPAGKVEEVQVVEDRTWIKVNYCFIVTYVDLECRGDFSFWFRPYDNNGKVTNWSYASKETSLEP